VLLDPFDHVLDVIVIEDAVVQLFKLGGGEATGGLQANRSTVARDEMLKPAAEPRLVDGADIGLRIGMPISRHHDPLDSVIEGGLRLHSASDVAFHSLLFRVVSFPLHHPNG